MVGQLTPTWIISELELVEMARLAQFDVDGDEETPPEIIHCESKTQNFTMTTEKEMAEVTALICLPTNNSKSRTELLLDLCQSRNYTLSSTIKVDNGIAMIQKSTNIRIYLSKI